MHPHPYLLMDTKERWSETLISFCPHFLLPSPSAFMDLENKLGQNYASEPIHFQENYLKPNYNIEDEIPSGVSNSSQSFLPDFHHADQFQANGSSSNPVFVVQTPTFDPFDNFSSADFDVYETKPFVENTSGGGCGHVIDNFHFQYGNCSMNFPQRNSQVDIMATNQSCLLFNSQEMMNNKPVSFVVPDEVSCISPAAVYFKRDGMDKTNRASTITRRSYKVRNKSNIIKGQWTVEEDRLLIQMVDQYGVRKWSHIAQMLPGRIGKQCRERWHNHLRPDIKKDTWTDEEDKVLIQTHAEIGNKWAEIAKRLPGRTENSIKNHWNATKRRQYSKRKCRSKYPRGSLLQEYIKSLNLDQNPQIDYRKKSSFANNANNTSTSKAAIQSHGADQFCPNDQLVPNFDFNEVPEFCFDDSMFQEGCSIDSLLDDMPCAPNMDGKMQCAANMVEKNSQGKVQCASVVNVEDHRFEKQISQEMATPMAGVEVKKEMDLVEMIMSHVN